MDRIKSSTSFGETPEENKEGEGGTSSERAKPKTLFEEFQEFTEESFNEEVKIQSQTLSH